MDQQIKKDSLITIVIAAKNAQTTIAKCLGSALSINYQNYEVIVVNDGSTDHTTDILKTFPEIKVFTTSGVGPASARNLALKEAKGEMIAFTDADCIVSKEWLNKLLEGFINKRVAGVGGIQRLPEDSSSFSRGVQDFFLTFGFISDYMKVGKKIRFVQHNPSCNVMYRKAILLELGGFLKGLWPGEDVELDYRIRKNGYLLVFHPEAAVYHYRANNLTDFKKMFFRYGKSAGWLTRKYGYFRAIHFLPIILLSLVAIFYYHLSLAIIFFGAMVLTFFVKIIFNRKNPFLMAGLLFFALIFWHLGYLSGLFWRLEDRHLRH